MRIAYFVHDLNDAAVARRVAMFAGAGHSVDLVGFRRSDQIPAPVSGVRLYDLGLTADGRLMARAGKVLRNVLVSRRLRRIACEADALIARNLESLVLAARVRQRGQRLVYECLDIHGLLLGRGLATRLLHAVESWAMRGLDLLLVSAPAFRDSYFRERRGYGGPVLLLENKVPGIGVVHPLPLPPGGEGRAWVIGWFGMLRCRRTLAVLGEIVRATGGRVEIIIAGKPSPAEFPDFTASIAALPGVSYLGPYAPADLPSLYARVHFIWAIDWFEDGLNSRWLLPNRLYEGLAHEVVPIAMRDVATGAWLTAHRAGLVLSDPQAQLPELLARMTGQEFEALRAAVRAVPQGDVTMLPAENAAALAAILALPGAPDQAEFAPAFAFLPRTATVATAGATASATPRINMEAM